MNSSKASNGFTLLELLIALAIFSIMAVMAYGGVRLVIDGDRHIEQSADSLSELQRAFLYLQQDLEQAVPRGIVDEVGSKEVAFVCCADDKLLHLTRGAMGSAMIGAPNLRRVEYSLTEGRLERRVWSTLDRVQDSKSSYLRLMEQVQSVDIQVLSYGETEWEGSPASEIEADTSVLPRAIKVTIVSEHYGAVSRLFIIGS